jgi:hypothetical protein
MYINPLVITNSKLFKMPSITRSQSKVQYTTVILPTYVKSVNWEVIKMELVFTTKMKTLLKQINENAALIDKIKLTTEVYSTINENFSRLYENNKFKWINFISIAFNKMKQIEEEIKNQPHYKFDEEALENFNRELLKTKEYTLKILSGDTSFTVVESVLTARKNIREMMVQRPKRIIKRVNYTGMDMNEDDEGSISVCKPHFTRTENGVKIKYNWEKHLLAQANEIGDEDYFEDEEENDIKDQEQDANPRRSPRNLKRISYEGMDMNQDDQGEFKISRKKIDDGNNIHYWVSAPSISNK